MKRTEAIQVGDIIKQCLESENLETQFDERCISYAWPDVVGSGINSYTMERYVKNGVLFVRISSAPLRNELMMNRSVLVQRLNDAVGKPVINDIRFI